MISHDIKQQQLISLIASETDFIVLGDSGRAEPVEYGLLRRTWGHPGYLKLLVKAIDATPAPGLPDLAGMLVGFIQLDDVGPALLKELARGHLLEPLWAHLYVDRPRRYRGRELAPIRPMLIEQPTFDWGRAIRLFLELSHPPLTLVKPYSWCRDVRLSIVRLYLYRQTPIWLKQALGTAEQYLSDVIQSRDLPVKDVMIEKIPSVLEQLYASASAAGRE